MTLATRKLPVAVVIALLDQVWLSAVNLIIGFAFIWYGEKADYGLFAMLISCQALLISMLNALILSPTMTLYPIRDNQGQDILSTAKTTLVIFSGIAGVLACAVVAVASWLGWHAMSAIALLAFGVSCIAVLLREGGRSLSYSQGDAHGALRLDICYGAIVFSGLLVLIANDDLRSVGVLSITALAGLVVALPAVLALASVGLNFNAWTDFWSCGKWALPGVFVGWVGLYSYPLIAGSVLHPAAVADLTVSRLFLMPVALVGVAWSNTFRPRIARLVAARDYARVRAIVRRSSVACIAGIALYVTPVIALQGWIESFLGSQYEGLLLLVIAWSVYFAISTTRGVFMAVLLVESSGYRLLTQIGLICTAIGVVALLQFAKFGVVWIVGGLCLIELLQLGLISGFSLRYLRAHGMQR